MAKLFFYLVMIVLIIYVGYNIFEVLNGFLQAYNSNLNAVINSIN